MSKGLYAARLDGPPGGLIGYRPRIEKRAVVEQRPNDDLLLFCSK